MGPKRVEWASVRLTAPEAPLAPKAPYLKDRTGTAPKAPYLKDRTGTAPMAQGALSQG